MVGDEENQDAVNDRTGRAAQHPALRSVGSGIWIINFDLDKDGTYDIFEYVDTSNYYTSIEQLDTCRIEGSWSGSISEETIRDYEESVFPNPDYDYVEYVYKKITINFKEPSGTIGPPALSLDGAEVKLSASAFTYNGEVQKPAIVSIKGSKLTEGTDYTAEYSNASSKDAGTYTITITGKGNCIGTTTATYVIRKAANTLKVKAKTATVKYSKLKKKAQTLKVGKVIRFTDKGQGKLSYKKSGGSKKITIDKKTGKVTVKKGLKKGTYKIKVQVNAAGDSNYKARKQTVTITIKIK